MYRELKKWSKHILKTVFSNLPSKRDVTKLQQMEWLCNTAPAFLCLKAWRNNGAQSDSLGGRASGFCWGTDNTSPSISRTYSSSGSILSFWTPDGVMYIRLPWRILMLPPVPVTQPAVKNCLHSSHTSSLYLWYEFNTMLSDALPYRSNSLLPSVDVSEIVTFSPVRRRYMFDGTVSSSPS